MRKRTLMVALLAALTVILVLSFAGIALADVTWPDLPDTVTAKYDITDNQVASISNGFADGLWRPYQDVTRAQFTKMGVMAFEVPQVTPATPSFTDVPSTNIYFPYIEGAKAVGMVNGVTATTFQPNANITREQAIAILVRYVAKINGYNLATQYTAAQITALLAPFGDAGSVSSALKTEMAFAVDFGITQGNDFGNLAPQGVLTRIQAAALILRAESMVPKAGVVPAKITVVGPDKSENLIGRPVQVTFKVTQADGSAAPGVLVDFDTLFSDNQSVGNISPQAAMTDANGQVTVNLLSGEPGTERVSAAVANLPAVYTTAYWLVMDEVYTAANTDNKGLNTGYPGFNDDGSAVPVQNNAGTTHQWSVQVTEFGPGPRSTSTQDWYNAVSTATFDPTNLKPGDGIDASHDYHEYEWSQDFVNYLLTQGYLPRTHPEAGGAFPVTVNWSILAKYDPDAVPDDGALNPPTDKDKDAVNSVGTISAISSGGTIATGGQSASGLVDGNGISTITITSQAAGFTPTQAVANYAGNPYPGTLFSHETFSNDSNHLDWEAQPDEYAFQLKQWIPHVIGGETGPLTLASYTDNTGEDELATLTLVDVYGNPIPGYQVEWTVQGVGVLKNAETVTGPDGVATATLYSSEPGQSIVETKILDKSGLPAFVYTAVKQWYQIDSVAFTPATLWKLDSKGKPIVGTPSTNTVGTTHTFTVQVSGIKWVWTSTDINDNGLHDDEAMVISRDSAFNTAGTIINEDGTLGATKPAGQDLPVQTVMKVGSLYVTRFADETLQGAEYWAPAPGNANVTILWSGLAGKGVDFFNNIGDADVQGTDPTSNTPIPVEIGGGTGGMPEFVGTIQSVSTPPFNKTYGATTYKYDSTTDANGQASVTITSQQKGDQYIYAVVDYPGNPQSTGALNASVPLQWSQLMFATAEKIWTADTSGTGVTDKVFGVRQLTDQEVGADQVLPSPVIVDGNSYTNPILSFTYPTTGAALITIAAPPAGTAATGVTATVTGGTAVFSGLPAGAGYTVSDIGRAVTAVLPGTAAAATATLGTTPPTDNSVGLITVTNGGSNYAVAPTVVIGAPNIAGGTQATAVANVSGGSVVSVTITNPGSGYTAAPAVSFTSNNTAGTQIGTIATIDVNNAVATITSTATSFPDGTYNVTVPAPLKVQATATATVVGGTITAINVVNHGDGYITAPAVIISGTGTGAAAHSVLGVGTPGAAEVASVVVDAGGTGFTVTANQTNINPNRETLAVEVYDKYGNSLPGYKVVWQIVQQGTTTSGTVPTYHPYAHFENAYWGKPDRDPNNELKSSQTYGIGDTDRHVKINPIWSNSGSDDDLAWGYTLDGQINFTESLSSAAHVDLVMDQPNDLLTMAREDPGMEFSDIVNVTVYDPNGNIFDQFTQIKNWVVPPVPATQVHMWLSTNITDTSGPWVTSLTTDNQTVSYKVQVGDPANNPAPASVLIKVTGTQPSSIPPLFGVGVGPNGVAYGIGALSTLLASGTYTFTPYIDADFSGTISSGDIPGAPVTLTIP